MPVALLAGIAWGAQDVHGALAWVGAVGFLVALALSVLD